MKRILPYLLIAAGTILVYLGALDLIDSYFGQQTAARTFVPATASSYPISPRPPRIRRGDTIAELSIPRLNSQLYVLEGDDDQELRWGPGHMPGTAMPGSTGNSVIAGHRDTHFRVLKDIREGDRILLRTSAGAFRYQVRSTSIVDPENTASLQPTPEAVLHLVTCYPFHWVGPAPKRFVVEAELEQAWVE